MIRSSAAAVLAGLGVIAAGTIGTGVAGARPTVPDGSALEGLLLSSRQIASLLDAPGMTADGTSAKLFDSSRKIDAPECVSAWGPAEQQSYAGSDWDSVAVQIVSDGDGGDVQHAVIQSVVSFPSAVDATAYMATAAQSWVSCANQTITFTPSSGEPSRWRMGRPSLNGEETAMVLPQQASSGNATCERAVGLQGNIVIDVMACGYGRDAVATGQAVALVSAIAASADSSSS